MGAKAAMAPINARVDESLRKQFTVEAAERGITIQTAMEEALTYWIAKQEEARMRTMEDAPLIPAVAGEVIQPLTGEEIDALIFG